MKFCHLEACEDGGLLVENPLRIGGMVSLATSPCPPSVVPMTLVQAPALGIDRFANDRHRENWSAASAQDRDSILRAIYQQVLGQQYVMDSERLGAAESLFRTGYLNVREFVRTLAKSGLYRARFFENCNPYRFIELNHKHLLGRAPHNKAEMLDHFTTLQDQGYDAEIDSYIDSNEYQNRFGSDVVPYLHGWDYSKGLQGQQFSWLMQLARGAAASVKGDGAGNQFKLGQALHQNRAIAVSGILPRFSGTSYFKACQSSGSDLYAGADFRSGRADSSPIQQGRNHALVGAQRGRVAIITVSALCSIDVCRSSDYVMRVPLNRMNQALERIAKLGGVVLNVAVR